MNSEKNIDKSIDLLLQKIEQECSEEPDTLLHLEPRFYTTEHLLQLRVLWQKRNKAYRKTHQIVFTLGALSPLFFALGMTGFFIHALVGIIFLPLSIISFIVFLFGSFAISARFKNTAYQNSILENIDKELKERGQFTN